jgi:hypothetical protein
MAETTIIDFEDIEEKVSPEDSLYEFFKKYPEADPGPNLIPQEKNKWGNLKDKERFKDLWQEQYYDTLPFHHVISDGRVDASKVQDRANEKKDLETKKAKLLTVPKDKRDKSWNNTMSGIDGRLTKISKLTMENRGGTKETQREMRDLDTRKEDPSGYPGDRSKQRQFYTDKADDKDLSMWEKLAKYFSENADARDKLFNYASTIGKELVKPIEPGQEAAGALVPRLSTAIDKSQKEYSAMQTQAVENALRRAEALQKMNPMQYMSKNMMDARGYVEGLGIDPDSAAGQAEISKYLLNVGISPAIVSLQDALAAAEEDLQMYQMGGTVDEKVLKDKQTLVEQYRTKISNLLQGNLGGSTVTETFTDTQIIDATGGGN